LRIFKNRPFARFAKREKIGDALLCAAVGEAERGLIAADLGGGVIKQRVGRPGQGKSGGFRTLIVFRAHSIAIFVHGFAKNERDNVGRGELAALKRLASELLSYDKQSVQRAVAAGALEEVICDEETIS